VVKTAGVDESIWTFTGPARVFESQDDAVTAILSKQIVPGDVVVFVTDGVPEAPAAAAQIGPVGAVGRNVAFIPPRAPSEFFGFTRLASSAGHWATTATNAQGCLDGIWADAEAWSGARFDYDDMTLVVLRYSG